MVWIVRTKESVGIFLNYNKVRNGFYFKNAEFEGVESYAQALTQMQQLYDKQIDFNDFYPNCLYRIKEKERFIIVETITHIGVVDNEQFGEVMSRNGLLDSSYRQSGLMEYQEACCTAFQKGANTGKDRLFSRKPVRANVFYQKRKW